MATVSQKLKDRLLQICGDREMANEVYALFVLEGSGSVTSVTASTGLSGGVITTTGTIAIAASGVTAASYGSASAVPVLAINAQGQVTSASTAAIPQILSFTSAAGAGGAATEAMVVTGILATDTILSVSQSVKGANSLPLLGFNTLANNALTAVFSADPGAGAVIVVSVKR